MTAYNDYTSARAHDADAAITPQHPQDSSPSNTSTDTQIPTSRLAAYIRHIVDTAPAPTPAQLERLASLLRDPDNPSPRSASPTRE